MRAALGWWVTPVSLSKLSSGHRWSRMDRNCAQIQVPAHAWVSPGHGLTGPPALLAVLSSSPAGLLQLF